MYAKINAKQDVHDLRAPYGVLRLFVFTLRSRYMQVIYAPDEPRLFLLQEKHKDSQIQPAPCRDQDDPGSGISRVYLCIYARNAVHDVCYRLMNIISIHASRYDIRSSRFARHYYS